MQDPIAVLSNIGNFYSVFSFLWWIALPPLLWYIFDIIWFDYVAFYSKDAWNSKLKWTVVEIIPPREIEKGPKMMEAFFDGMSGTLASISTFDALLGGKFDDRFSLEIVGEEGRVHFYMRIQPKYISFVEANIYAQYPEAQVIEVEDYVDKFPRVIPNKKWSLWGSDFQFTKPNIYPIKTYDKFEESVTGEMNDPLAAVIEVMGSMGPGQHMWLQYVVLPLKEEEFNKKDEALDVIAKLTGREKPKPKGFLGHLGDVFSNIFAAMFGPVEFAKSEKKDEAPLEFRLSPIEKDVLKAVEENRGRWSFSVKMRMIFLGRKEVFDKTFVGVFIGALKQFGDFNLNGLKPESITKTYGVYLGGKRRLAFRQRKIYNRYKKRVRDGVKLVFSNKEMATLYHFPDKSVKSPAVTRVDAKRGTPPPNLPVGE